MGQPFSNSQQIYLLFLPGLMIYTVWIQSTVENLWVTVLILLFISCFCWISDVLSVLAEMLIFLCGTHSLEAYISRELPWKRDEDKKLWTTHRLCLFNICPLSSWLWRIFLYFSYFSLILFSSLLKKMMCFHVAVASFPKSVYTWQIRGC